MNSPSSVLPEPMQMSVRDALKLNAWAGVVVAAAFVSRLLLRDHDLSGAPRVIGALLPLLPGLLYVRAIWSWMRGLDEMQQRIHLEAVSFAALAMLFLAFTVDLLQLAGFVPSLRFGWEGYFAFTFFLWAAGLARSNRRYR